MHRKRDALNASLIMEAKRFGEAQVAISIEVYVKLGTFGVVVEDPTVVGVGINEIGTEPIIGLRFVGSLVMTTILGLLFTAVANFSYSAGSIGWIPPPPSDITGSPVGKARVHAGSAEGEAAAARSRNSRIAII